MERLKLKLVCRGNRGSDLAPEALATSGNTPLSIFHLTIGHSYPAYAMALWRSGLAVLTVDDLDKPHWYLLSLFDVADGHLPPGWAFAVPGRDVHGPVRALWGYPALVNDPTHHDALIDRQVSALRTFLQQCDRSGVEPDDLRKLASLDELVANWNKPSPTAG